MSQADRMIDLYLACRLASEAWKDIAPINQQRGCDFRELSEVKEIVDELNDDVPWERLEYLLRENLPHVIFHKHFATQVAA